MAAITISAPIVAKAPVAMRRTRVTARAAVAPAASTSAVSFGARKMDDRRFRAAARVQQIAAGRKSSCGASATRQSARIAASRTRARHFFARGEDARPDLRRASRAARGRPIAQGFGHGKKHVSSGQVSRRARCEDDT